jgi:hypothetical protein
MVEERGYESRVRVQAGAPLPGVSADAFGAGLGRAIEQAGEVLHSERIEDARLDRSLRDNSEWAAFQTDFALTREELAAAAREGRKSDDPGHAARIAEEWQKREGALLGKLTSTRLKERAQGTLSEWGASFRAREADWEDLRQSEIVVERHQEQFGIAEGRVRRLESPGDYAAEVKIQMDAIAGLAVSDAVKDKLADEAEQRLAVSYLRGMIDRDPAAAQALIDSGGFDGVLTGDQVEALRDSSAVEIRRYEAAAEREKAEQVAVLRENLQTFKEAEQQGLVTDPGQFDQAIAGALAVGDKSLALELEGLKANQQFVRIWGPENATALQRENRLAELASKPARSDSENRELAFLRQHNGIWAAEEARDPVGQAAARGGNGAPPPIDFTDPASIAARGKWAAARAAQGQRLPAFTAVEMRELGTLYDSGRSGEEQVLSILSALPPEQAMESARRIEPNDRTLPIIATLQPGVRNMARRGREALRADKSLLFKMLEDDPDLNEAYTSERLAFEQALRFAPPEQRAAIFETAKQIAAGQVDKFGETMTPALWQTSLQLAVGGVKTPDGWAGGLGKWGESTYRLPEGVTHRGFTAAVTRAVQATQDPPVNPDGSTANLFRLAPVEVGEGVYEFRNAAGDPVRRKSGKLYRVTVRPR